MEATSAHSSTDTTSIRGGVTNLTATPDAKHRWGGWSHDGEHFAFTSNRRDRRADA